MNTIEFENTFDLGILDEEYMDYIMEHADPMTFPICNGDTLLAAFEVMYLYEEFKEYKTK